MSQCKSCGGFCGQYGCERERNTAAGKMTRDQWIKKVMWAYEHGARHGAERQLFQSMLANIPEPECSLTTCRHCGFRVKLNEVPETEYKGE